MLNVVDIREKQVGPGQSFKFAVVQGTPADHASWYSFEDEQIVRDRHWHLKPGETVLDVGAAFGSYALPALAMGARVVAFNPADFDTLLMTKNLELNPELAERCLMVRDGIHERDGWFDPDRSLFRESPEQEEGQTSEPILYGMIGHGEQKQARQWLRVRSLDSFLAERPGIGRVDWIKLDIEGAEAAALRGGIECIRRWRPKLLVECHNFIRPTLEREVVEFVAGLGLGYQAAVHPHHAVSHAYFEAPR